MRKIPEVVRLKRVLVHSVAGAASDTEVLHGLQEHGSDRRPAERGPKAINHSHRASPALAEWFQSDDIDTSAVDGTASSARITA